MQYHIYSSEKWKLNKKDHVEVNPEIWTIQIKEGSFFI